VRLDTPLAPEIGAARQCGTLGSTELAEANRSLGVAKCAFGFTIPKSCGLEDATQPLIGSWPCYPIGTLALASQQDVGYSVAS
jgi:hypothetical protein